MSKTEKRFLTKLDARARKAERSARRINERRVWQDDYLARKGN